MNTQIPIPNTQHQTSEAPAGTGHRVQATDHRPQATAVTDLGIIIVSWNVWDHLRACLTSIKAQTQATDELHIRGFGPRLEATVQVVVVDNASDDATPSLLASRFPWVQAIFSDENVGFTRGNNRALEALGVIHGDWREGSRDSPLGFRFVLFLNPDTELLPASLWALYAGIEEDETIGAIGPQLRYGDGALQSSRRCFPTPLTGFFESTWLEQAWPQNPWTRHYHLANWSAACRQDVDWLVGCALLVRGEVLTSVGGFDPQFFMYSEEMDLCRRIKHAGWRVVYEPAAVVIHYEGRSSEQVSTKRQILFNRSKVRYARKWHGPLWATLLRHYLLAEFRAQLLLERLKAFLGHKRDLRRIRVAAYREVLKSKLQ